MAEDESSVSDVLDTLEKQASQEDCVSVGDVTKVLGGRGFGPLILVPALLTVSPLGGIPTVPTLMAVVVALFAVQMLLGREAVWLPGFIKDRAVKDSRIEKATEKLRGVASWLDEHMGQRLAVLIRSPMPQVAAGLVIGLCLLVPPSEIVPFAALVPMGAIALIGLALTLRDGLVMLGALGASLAALYALWGWVI